MHSIMEFRKLLERLKVCQVVRMYIGPNSFGVTIFDWYYDVYPMPTTWQKISVSDVVSWIR